jgi:hypothetical protein
MQRRRVILLVGLLALALGPAARAGITFQFDYEYDGGFFAANPEAKTTLEFAAASLARFTDDLAAIVPAGLNTWEARFTRPDDGKNTLIQNLVVPADTLIVYAGGRDLEGALGSGGPGGFFASGISPDWLDTVEARGEAGGLTVPATDFGPWGGQIAFNNEPDVDWYFGIDPGGRGPGQSDFLSVALHELGHLLGFGTAGAWNAQVAGPVFTGPAASTVYGGSVPVQVGGRHWAPTIAGEVDGVAQEAAMDPQLTQGARKLFTDLDFAGLDDLGWEVADAQAAWSGAASTAWSDDGNWTTGLPPVPSSTAVFEAAAPYQPTLGTDALLRRLEFRSTGWTVSGAGTLTVYWGGATSAAGGTNTVAVPVALGSGSTWTVEGGGTLDLAGGLDIGGFTLVKDGEGLLVISGDQDHADGSHLDILAGTVEMRTDAGGTGLMEDVNLSIYVAGATLNLVCDQHLDTLEIGDGGLVSFTGADVVVVRRLILNGMDLGATTLTPEPATLALVALGAGVLVARRRR